MLSKEIQRVPWESIPLLCGHPVTRIPSIFFLFDQLSNVHKWSTPMVDGTPIVKAPRAFYVLNPDNDLDKTQNRLKWYALLPVMFVIYWKVRRCARLGGKDGTKTVHRRICERTIGLHVFCIFVVNIVLELQFVRVLWS